MNPYAKGRFSKAIQVCVIAAGMGAGIALFTPLSLKATSSCGYRACDSVWGQCKPTTLDANCIQLTWPEYGCSTSQCYQH